MRIAMGSDHAGCELKAKIEELLTQLNHECCDWGCHTSESVDYPDYAKAVVKSILQSECERGILICGTGIGMSIAANRYRGIRATLCNDVFTAELSRSHNDSNVLVLGARVIGTDLAMAIVKTWLNTSFSGGKHSRRLDKIEEPIEEHILRPSQ